MLSPLGPATSILNSEKTDLGRSEFLWLNGDRDFFRSKVEDPPKAGPKSNVVSTGARERRSTRARGDENRISPQRHEGTKKSVSLCVLVSLW
jgi:hypothetical protein